METFWCQPTPSCLAKYPLNQRHCGASDKTPAGASLMPGKPFGTAAPGSNLMPHLFGLGKSYLRVPKWETPAQ